MYQDLGKYLKALSSDNDLIIQNLLSEDEAGRVLEAEIRWARSRKTASIRNRSVKKGEIYQFEFGKNYAPEMSYEHRGLVIGVKQDLCYVLPIFSYIREKHLNVFHPSLHPGGTLRRRRPLRRPGGVPLQPLLHHHRSPALPAVMSIKRSS